MVTLEDVGIQTDPVDNVSRSMVKAVIKEILIETDGASYRDDTDTDSDSDI